MTELIARSAPMSPIRSAASSGPAALRVHPPHRATSDATSVRTLLMARIAPRITPYGVMTQQHGDRILRESFRV